MKEVLVESTRMVHHYHRIKHNNLERGGDKHTHTHMYAMCVCACARVCTLCAHSCGQVPGVSKREDVDIDRDSIRPFHTYTIMLWRTREHIYIWSHFGLFSPQHWMGLPLPFITPPPTTIHGMTLYEHGPLSITL